MKMEIYFPIDFLTFRLHVWGNGSCGDISMISLSVAHFSPVFQASRSLLTVSFHPNLGLPLGYFPSIFISAAALMFPVSSLLFPCPSHSNRLLHITIAISSTFVSSKISILRRSTRCCSSHAFAQSSSPIAALGLIKYNDGTC